MPVYLDCAATTPLDPRVREIVLRHLKQEFGNAGSRTHEPGRRAHASVEQARAQVAALAGASRGDVIFTSGVTESNNLALLGPAAHGDATGRRHIVSPRIEHHAGREPLDALRRRGFDVTLVATGSGRCRRRRRGRVGRPTRHAAGQRDARQHVALRHLAPVDPRVCEAARRGVGWLLDLQNRDGGIPTFCRGWGALPFDRSAPDLTAHALQAWAMWDDALDAPLRARVSRATARACAYLIARQLPEGSWLPLWFGSEHVPDEANPVYGTARVLAALAYRPGAPSAIVRARARGARWLCAEQNTDGGWGGARGAPSSIEETGVALQAIARCGAADPCVDWCAPADRAVAWLADATGNGCVTEAAPIGFYFARLWYDEELYPLAFALAGLVELERTTPLFPRREDPQAAWTR